MSGSCAIVLAKRSATRGLAAGQQIARTEKSARYPGGKQLPLILRFS